MSSATNRREIDLIRASRRLKVVGDGVDAQDIVTQTATIQQATLGNVQITGTLTYPGSGGGGNVGNNGTTGSLTQPLQGSNLSINTAQGGRRGLATIEQDHTFNFSNSDIFDDHRNLNLTNATAGLVAWTTRSNILNNDDICIFDYIHDHATGSFNIANLNSQTGSNYQTFLTLTKEGLLSIPNAVSTGILQSNAVEVDGNVTFTSLSQTLFNNNNEVVTILDTSGNLTLPGNLTTNQLATLNGGITTTTGSFSGSIAITNITQTINGISNQLVDTSGNIIGVGTLNVSKLASLNGGLNTTSGVFTNGVTTTKLLQNINGTTNQILDTNGNVVVPGTWTSTGLATLNGGLTTANATFTNNVSVNNITQTIGGTVFQILDASGNAIVPGTLKTTGLATFSSGTFTNNVSVSKISQTIGSTTTQILDATGNVIIPGTLTTTGLVTFNNLTTANGTFTNTLSVNKVAQTIGGTTTQVLDASGNVIVPGTLTAVGLATLNGGLSSTTGTFTNTITISKLNQTINGNAVQLIDASGNITIPGTLTATGLATFNNSLTSTNGTFTNSLSISKLTQTINGTTTQLVDASGNVIIPGTLITTGLASFSTGTFTNTLSVNKIAQTISGTTTQILDASGNVIVPGTLTATGLATLNGGISSTTGAFTGNVTVNGTLTAPNIQTAVTISALYKGTGATVSVANGAIITIPSASFASAGTIYTNTSINSSTSAVSITAPGNYVISYTVFSPSSVIGALQLYFTSSSLGSQLGTTSQYASPGYVTVTYTGPLAAGDVITPSGLNNSGTAINLVFDSNCTFSICSLSAVATPTGPNNAAAIFSQYPLSGPVSSTAGTFIQSNPQTYTDNTTASSTTASGNFSAVYMGAPTLRATNTAVTTSNASTLTIAGPPIAGTNETITSAYAMNVQNGNSYFNGNVAANSLSNNSTVNTSIYKLIYSTTTSTSASVSVPNGSSKNITPSMVAVLPSPYSIQYTPAANCVFTVPTTGKWRFFFSGSWGNSGANGAAGGYVHLRFDYTQGANTYTEVNCVTQPGGNSYGHQIFLEGWFVKNDTVTPSVFNLSGNTMIFYFVSFVAVSNPF